MKWPPLPVEGFITGRSATVKDIDQGSAVFCQQSDDDDSSRPCAVEVPQYVIWHEDNEADVHAILVQAERHITDPDGDAVFGLRTFDGNEVVALSSEVTLLGKKAPTG